MAIKFDDRYCGNCGKKRDIVKVVKNYNTETGEVNGYDVTYRCPSNVFQRFIKTLKGEILCIWDYDVHYYVRKDGVLKTYLGSELL